MDVGSDFFEKFNSKSNPEECKIKVFCVGQPVLVRDEPDPEPFMRGFIALESRQRPDRWELSLYAYYDKLNDQHITINGFGWDQCIQFEGNEKLLGTYDDPSEE